MTLRRVCIVSFSSTADYLLIVHKQVVSPERAVPTFVIERIASELSCWIYPTCAQSPDIPISRIGWPSKMFLSVLQTVLRTLTLGRDQTVSLHLLVLVNENQTQSNTAGCHQKTEAGADPPAEVSKLGW
jgi:hypothetical protein